MDGYGYRLASRAQAQDTDFIPSLIGIDPEQLHATPTDVYFERVEAPLLVNLNVTCLVKTRWVTYDNVPHTNRDPIVGVKAGTISFYMPLSELIELATDQSCTDVLEMLAKFSPAQVHS